MKARCYNPHTPGWKHYGGRGITVCQEWVESFEKFRSYMGDPPPGKTIDRINNDGNYEPGNVRWATPIQQARNRRGSMDGGERATETLKFSLTPKRKAAWAKAAGELPVYLWIRRALDRAANYKPKET
jgi:hypothetical protein